MTTQQKFEITKKWNTLEEFYNSDEIKELYKQYEYVLMRDYKLSFLKGEVEFICGISYKGELYEAIRIDGTGYFNKLSISGSIDNRNFGIAKIEKNTLTILLDCFLCNDSTRRMAAKSFPENAFLTKVII